MECIVEKCKNDILIKSKGLCKSCYGKELYLKNKEVIIARVKKYQSENKDIIKIKKNDYNKNFSKRDREREKISKPLYKTWEGIKLRCYNPNFKQYKDYGGRGIKMCDRWKKSYREFEKDMGERPEGMTLDRIDVNGDYTPDNCRWATWVQQNNNKRNNKN